MAQGSYTFLSVAIRRLTEPPKPLRKPKPKPKPTSQTTLAPKRKKHDPKLVLSLAVLLEVLNVHNAVLTRTRQRRMYRTAMKNLPSEIGMRSADRDFDRCAGKSGCAAVPKLRIRNDLRLLKRAAKRVKKRVDKIHAHIELDARRIGKPIGLREIDDALRVLLEVHARYALLIQGSDVSHIMTDDFFDIKPDLHKIWPPR
jgi:hypothetical protein